jgi:serine/threonine protein kinase
MRLLLWCHLCVPLNHAHKRRYETTNHLWLILEYCVGGDLMSLLRQDVRLPEASIHDFARDMVVALQVRSACRHACVRLLAEFVVCLRVRA